MVGFPEADPKHRATSEKSNLSKRRPSGRLHNSWLKHVEDSYYEALEK